MNKIKRLLLLVMLVPGTAAAECYWINGQYACTLGNNPQPYAAPVNPYYPPPPTYYYPPPAVYIPPITPGQIPPPPGDWGNSKFVPIPERRNIWGE
jgi:hypothetical protein